jgi:hypothetical protein
MQCKGDGRYVGNYIRRRNDQTPIGCMQNRVFHESRASIDTSGAVSAFQLWSQAPRDTRPIRFAGNQEQEFSGF